MPIDVPQIVVAVVVALVVVWILKVIRDMD